VLSACLVGSGLDCQARHSPSVRIAGLGLKFWHRRSGNIVVPALKDNRQAHVRLVRCCGYLNRFRPRRGLSIVAMEARQRAYGVPLCPTSATLPKRMG
jgi:hypothetical protein